MADTCPVCKRPLGALPSRRCGSCGAFLPAPAAPAIDARARLDGLAKDEAKRHQAAMRRLREAGTHGDRGIEGFDAGSDLGASLGD